MLVPVSWLKDYVEIDIPVEVLAERLTLAGLEVAHLNYIGIPQAHIEGVRWPESHHLVWDREKILFAAIREVKSHPDADRLVLAMVDYGGDELEQCVTGAPNLFAYKDQGELENPLWTAFAAEGAEVWDGHSDEPKRMILKGRELRGIYNKSMVCSEKELGISDEHEGVILMEEPPRKPDGDPFAPGTPLQDVLGDVVLDIELTPNLGRCFSMFGVAREVAALLDKQIKYPSFDYLAEGAPIAGTVDIDIREPELNPRFTLALLRNTKVQPSPRWMQRRLKLVGQRPINNIVDVTNYITFEIGQPLHAFDYDKLVERNKGEIPTIITRLPETGETLETLDEVKRQLQPYNILVCDTQGVLSLGGLIGGAETEIGDTTTNVLLEAANWNFINIRKTMQSQKVFTDAGTRFSRGVHPSQAILGLQRGIELMRQTGGGAIAKGVIDKYPLPPEPVKIDLPVAFVRRLTGMNFAVEDAADILNRLQFDVTINSDMLHVIVPDHRMDISTGDTGLADLVEEIVRIYGYDAIPNTIMADEMPPQWANIQLEREERVRDLLVALGLRETISYRFTAPEREALLLAGVGSTPWTEQPYVEIANPNAPEKRVLRRTLLISLLENAITNRRYHARQQIFEIGNVFHDRPDAELPAEPSKLGLLMTGPRAISSWMGDDQPGNVDFYDLKGVVEDILDGLQVTGIAYERTDDASFHPGRSALVSANGEVIGTFGELHPRVAEAFGFEDTTLLAAEFDLDTLTGNTNESFPLRHLPVTPAVLEDIALVVAEDVPAADVEAVIVKAGGDLLKEVRLFDVYQGEPIPAGHKSLAYNLVYQTDERTLKDKDVARLRKKIIGAAEKQLGAKLRA
jgi:phenylalanyl-tRNA synthetase beta chain